MSSSLSKVDQEDSEQRWFEVAMDLLKGNPDKHGETLHELFNEVKVPEEAIPEVIDVLKEKGFPVPRGLERQKEEQLTEVFVKVFGLRKKELENEALIENIESKVKETLKVHPSPTLVPEQFPFSFPRDPTVSSASVAVVIEVNFCPVDKDDFEDAKGFADYLGDAVAQGFDEEEVEQRNDIWVSLPQLEVLY